MTKLSLRANLFLLALVPLLFLSFLGGSRALDYYQRYAQLQDAIVVQRLANVASDLGRLLPVTMFATGERKIEMRKAVENAFQTTFKTYDAYLATGANDAKIAELIGQLRKGVDAVKDLYAREDAGKSPAGESVGILQPLSAASLALTRQSGATINDLELARFIDGYHALLQLVDVSMIERGAGTAYVSNQKLLPMELSFLKFASDVRLIYGPTIEAQLPKDLYAAFVGFEGSEEGKVIARFRPDIFANTEGKTYSAADLVAWNGAMEKRVALYSGLLDKARLDLSTFAQARIDAAWKNFLFYALGTSILVLLGIAHCILAIRSITAIIRSISGRMTQLASGDTASSVAYQSRGDEIGEMARSVEFFRMTAIHAHELEQSAEADRRRAEAERLEVQRRAEEDANERLNKATGSLASGLKRLASGDMLCEIHDEFAPQFEALRHDFNTSVSQLRDVLVSVGQSSEVVNGGSGEISTASDNLAKRTEQQAASLEETAAALEEITSNVRMTSQRTVEARDLVHNARGKADHSGVVVGNAVEAMHRIEHASGQISQIISVIDEIAFQTNLLALNAGVEAARAGDAGKGFAVVAQEVRELAQRSANAAKEIKVLIGNSEAAVNEGVKLVNETGSGLAAIADVVQAISGHMDAIASAAQEQSSGLAEVNNAVNHMDQATQQNAAMVEEMNAASAGLAQEAGNLAGLLSQFRTASDMSRSAPRGRAA
jgi:methyl-accepting chemotaxis protein